MCQCRDCKWLAMLLSGQDSRRRNVMFIVVLCSRASRGIVCVKLCNVVAFFKLGLRFNSKSIDLSRRGSIWK